MRSVKLGIVAALLLSTALATPAFATGSGNNGNNNGNNQQDGGNGNGNNGCGNGNGGPNGGGNCGGNGGNGGNGGEGGEGGEGGDGGNSVSVNVNANKNYNKNENENKNYNTNYNKNEQEQKQHQSQYQGQSQSSYNKNENDNSNSNNASQNVEVNTHNERAPVNTAYAAGLSVGEDTCMGSSSIGAQAVSFGLSIGTTWQDDNCRRLKNSRQLVALGYHRAATSLMCVDEDVKNAMIMAGTPCPNGEIVVVAPPVREYVPMAPVVDRPHRKVRKVRKALPPK